MQDKTTEELIEMKASLKAQVKLLRVEEKQLEQQYLEAQKKTHTVDKQLRILTTELNHREILASIDKFIMSYKNGTQVIENFELLTDAELAIITSAMDKTDYRMCPSSNKQIKKFNDFEKMCKTVIFRKQNEPNVILTACWLCGQLDTFPPQSFYEYVYKDDLGRIIY